MFKTMCMISVCSCFINDVNLSSRLAPERPLPSHRGSQLSQSFPSSQSGLLVVNMQHRQYLIERYFVLGSAIERDVNGGVVWFLLRHLKRFENLIKAS